jgi:hypothetical protein
MATKAISLDEESLFHWVMNRKGNQVPRNLQNFSLMPGLRCLGY